MKLFVLIVHPVDLLSISLSMHDLEPRLHATSIEWNSPGHIGLPVSEVIENKALFQMLTIEKFHRWVKEKKIAID
jgi:hypothetical protein